MHITPIHAFDLSPAQMVAVQQSLRKEIVLSPYKGVPQVAAGVDLAYAGDWPSPWLSLWRIPRWK